MSNNVHEIFAPLLDSMKRGGVSTKRVYSLNIMSRISRLLGQKPTEPGEPALVIGEMHSLGNCEYSAEVKDDIGNVYLVTVEVLR